jgi:hypothetical protein
MKYKMQKVFDCQDMPEDVREAFFFFFKNDGGFGNDCCVEWFIHDTTDPDEETKMVDAWLIEHGAEGAKDDHSAGDKVIIKHWW